MPIKNFLPGPSEDMICQCMADDSTDIDLFHVVLESSTVLWVVSWPPWLTCQ